VPTSEAVSRGIRIRVESAYVSERSDPLSGEWFFSYRIRIANESDEAVQLLQRHWVITDAHGHIEEVRGPGVVGKQPVLAPGAVFEYTSFCPLRTSFGTMHGSYIMASENGDSFDAEIAPFSLAEPYGIN